MGVRGGGEDDVRVKFGKQRVCKQNIANNGLNAGRTGREGGFGNPGKLVVGVRSLRRAQGRLLELRVVRGCCRDGCGFTGTLAVHSPKFAQLVFSVKVGCHNSKIYFSVEKFGGQFSVVSTQYSVLCTQFSVLSTLYSVLSCRFSVLSTQYSVLSSQLSVLSSQYPHPSKIAKGGPPAKQCLIYWKRSSLAPPLHDGNANLDQYPMPGRQRMPSKACLSIAVLDALRARSLGVARRPWRPVSHNYRTSLHSIPPPLPMRYTRASSGISAGR